jgi:hypothetical protein
MKNVKDEPLTMDTGIFSNVFFQFMNKFEGRQEMLNNLPPEVFELIKDAEQLREVFREVGNDINPLSFLFFQIMNKPGITALVIDRNRNCEVVFSMETVTRNFCKECRSSSLKLFLVLI